MAFFNTLKTTFRKIEQKSIILISGNIDEIISTKMVNFENNKKSELNKFISLPNYLALHAFEKKYEKIEFFSASKGLLNLDINKKILKNEYDQNKNILENDEDDDFENSEIKSLDEYINNLNEYINNIENIESKSENSMHIIDCSELFLDKSGQGIQIPKLAQLISTFLRFKEGQSSISIIQNRKKLILLARNPGSITNFIPVNNVEFAAIDLLKPNKEEREEFISNFSSVFDVKNTIKDKEHEDFKDAVAITDGLSFREILQLAKLTSDRDENNELLTFKQLYSLATFNKQNSEWENLDASKIRDISAKLGSRVKGQDTAIEAIKSTLIRSFTGLSGIVQSTESKKPKGVLFLAGPTGTGKTEISKALAEFVFGDESRLIRFDMSEYNHEHSDQRLIGAPPGYVGYDAGGQLTSAVKNKPFSILLFDEIEKAHGKILDKFLQILEDGRLTSSQGEIVDFSETFIIFTSNIGTSTVKDTDDDETVRRNFIESVSQYFKVKLERPEILNRIGMKNIVPFNFIRDPEITKEILKAKLNKIQKWLILEKKIMLDIQEKEFDLLHEIVHYNYDSKMGGRGLVTELETIFIDKLAVAVFEENEKIKENRKNNKLTNIIFEIQGKEVKFKII